MKLMEFLMKSTAGSQQKTYVFLWISDVWSTSLELQTGQISVQICQDATWTSTDGPPQAGGWELLEEGKVI